MKKILLLLGIAAIPFCSNAQSLVASYSFDNGTAIDNSGNGLDGTLYGGVSTAAGKNGVAGTALQFDGSTGYILVPQSTLLNLSSWTISAMVKPMVVADQLCQGNMIVSYGDEYGASHYHMGITDNQYDNDCNTYSPNNTSFYGSAAGTPSSGPSALQFITTGQWYCATASYSGDTMYQYVNGDLISKEVWPSQYQYAGTQEQLHIGKDVRTNWNFWFNGVIDEVKVYSGAIIPGVNDTICNHMLTTAVAPVTLTTTNIHIYPNPATDNININVANIIGTIDMTLENAVGQQVRKAVLQTGNNNIDISNLPTGLYLIHITSGNGVRTEKIVKK